MNVYHLNCGSLCPRGGRLIGGRGGPWAVAPMCCHCLLIEGEDGLILVDSGLGVDDVHNPGRLGALFKALTRPRLDVAETALRQVADLGFSIADVRHIIPTHLDLDHAGGLADFPAATVHVSATELSAAKAPTWRERARYCPPQISHVENWAPVELGGEDWFGFASVRALAGARDDVLLVPLPGHSRGHCGVAVRTPDGWLLHCGDAYFHHAEVSPDGGGTPFGTRVFESLVNVDRRARRANQKRLSELAERRGDEVRLICSHDPAELAACRNAKKVSPGHPTTTAGSILA